jgi:hypothetical protein
MGALTRVEEGEGEDTGDSPNRLGLESRLVELIGLTRVEEEEGEDTGDV